MTHFKKIHVNYILDKKRLSSTILECAIWSDGFELYVLHVYFKKVLSYEPKADLNILTGLLSNQKISKLPGTSNLFISKPQKSAKQY